MSLFARVFGNQFGRPHGLLGQLVSRGMRQSNAPVTLWMVDLLAVAPQHRILEVGFGPGVALAELLRRAPDGFVAGVDASALMAQQARSRHADAIATGRLEIRLGDAASLPYEDATFDKICGSHVIYFWPDTVPTLRELRRVLRPGGLLALAYQEREHMPPRAQESLGQTGARLFGPGDVEQAVRSAGFANAHVETKITPDGPAGFCVLAVK